MSTIQTTVSGVIAKVHVQPGAHVAVGDVIVTVESMKMEIPVEAEEAGVIDQMLVVEGQQVSEDQAVATFV
ncbi:acyl-CoA carboxylase biotin carboxyl carrier protein subunit [Verminephrobacter eiseniae]|uniref:Biotin/lipoyl attachment domain-containing protein n=1 Tax=Verminephrobacter eiseniae (strain EF01-2) TaxID=391735 RepID=A1WG51_VEREI|nr:acetyl-CoA carboxylase biotin carboxyl carrier protein subunit [Verminephrobacter eiseniae]KAB7615075.1 acetyl-CoA carboxylase biotin carboxyl carrier protein subunit [Verminephrobacter sp. Larva24]ABM56608.1 biotin/lipoyl attachment domain-containing protein [Verminephrobacter eiseniae EF01-2]MCW5233686.1 acetyl-CoA carboxylase biotin carboxyl carrier protein subunit [Verminephrobacter eiseniae]MCW5261810.1 acetyl-CoA carboxylase biotin carboxyl carrier protein subunit [Verminephrobacter ei